MDMVLMAWVWRDGWDVALIDSTDLVGRYTSIHQT
jgi:hypothetical protein